MKSFRSFWQLFFMMGFLLAQVSPACAFVSGKASSTIQICSSDGSMKEITVSGSFDPFAKKTKDHKMGVKDCAFCFFQAHIGDTPFNTSVLEILISSSYRVTGSGTIVPVSLKHSQAQPRGPPSFS